MRRTGFVRLGAGVAVLGFIASAWHAAPRAPAPDALIAWADLVPPGWAPLPVGESLAAIRDDSPAARARWEEIQRAWASAPLRQSLDGVRVRIRGYAVPLDGGVGEITQMLLVPYFGACIHTPPPPANQIVWVRLKQPARNVGSFDIVDVAGRLSVSRRQSPLATSGYAMSDAVMLSTKKSGPR
jgi:uncharacterized protein